MAYSLPEWVDMGAIPGAARVDVGQPLDRGDGKRLRGKMTWCNFLAYLQRCSLRVRKFHFSDLGREIGRGRFFEVFRYEVREGAEGFAFSTQNGDFLEAGTVVALKRVIPQALEDNRVSLDDSRQLKAVATEIQALTKKSLREHENIIELYALAWEDRGGEAAYWPTMIMEYCPCTLAELQSERKSPLPLPLKLQIIQGISFGFDALQEEKIIHGDVKSENVLIQVMGDGLLIPKLADFGSCVVEISSDFVEIGGTDPWRAPEVSIILWFRYLS
jgi:serine/threonine protein kinase